jgi:hypothetical protein
VAGALVALLLVVAFAAVAGVAIWVTVTLYRGRS